MVPWRGGELTSFRRETDRLFDRFLEGWPFRISAEERVWAPTADVSETTKEVIVKVEVPGMDPKDIDVFVAGDVLTLRGERKREKEEKDVNFHRVERSYGSFSRSIRLPSEVDTGKVNATYKEGILKICLRRTKAASVRKIEVKPGYLVRISITGESTSPRTGRGLPYDSTACRVSEVVKTNGCTLAYGDTSQKRVRRLACLSRVYPLPADPRPRCGKAPLMD